MKSLLGLAAVVELLVRLKVVLFLSGQPFQSRHLGHRAHELLDRPDGFQNQYKVGVIVQCLSTKLKAALIERVLELLQSGAHSTFRRIGKVQRGSETIT